MATLTVDIRLSRDAGFSDVTIKCNETTFAAHKVVLCSHSTVLAAAFNSDFKRYKEGTSGHLEIDFDPDTVDRLLDVFYLGDYKTKLNDASESDEENQSLGTTEPPAILSVLHARMVMIADYYDVQNLKELALTRLDFHWRTSWNPQAFVRFLKECINCDVVDTLEDGLLPSAVKHI
ncbi:hypothetical protein KEM56_006371 [Ascosphaera pollenicola]|nr:hypothetical protein KEM56_006371 [Ascosphaera pollenicola]